MRFLFQHNKNKHHWKYSYSLLRMFLRGKNYHQYEAAYVKFGLDGLGLNVEFPSDWHEEARVWFRSSFGIIGFCFSLPWKWVSKDDGACGGHRYGFDFFSDLLFIFYGKSSSYPRLEQSKAISMPWSWDHKEHVILSEPETHEFNYWRNNGEIQQREATIYKESRLWKRFWLPYKLVRTTINISFNEEVGEKSGSWKGGVLGMSYEMKPGESPLDTLTRMELDCFTRKTTL